ncbi:MAG: hypothetical protein O2826_10975 [Chloroflexi bacterium]|nr:hypothetical protein [Chloroflexota bacterium]
MELSHEEWQKASAEAKARELRERETHYLLAMATLRHRGAGITLENQELMGGVPPGTLRFRVEVDSMAFWNVLHELGKRKGWK